MTEVEAIKEAIVALDALWDLDVERGLRDSRGGAEYERTSPAVVLRRMLQMYETCGLVRR